MAAYEEVVVDQHAEGIGGGGDFYRDRHVRARWFRIAAGVVVQKSRSVRSPLNYLRKDVRLLSDMQVRAERRLLNGSAVRKK